MKWSGAIVDLLAICEGWKSATAARSSRSTDEKMKGETWPYSVFEKVRMKCLSVVMFWKNRIKVLCFVRVLK